MRVVLEAVRLAGTWPVLQHVHLVLARRGVRDPVECVRTAPACYLVHDEPVDPGSCVRLTVGGLHEIEAHAPELNLFIGVLRGCVDTYRFHALDSPSRAQTLEVGATELVRAAREITQERLRVIALLMEVEDVAPIRFEPNSGCPWRVALGMEIWRFQGIADLAGYLSRPDP
jgi:hypothetical protein